MSARLTSQLLVSALIRRVQAQGGFAAVLHKGEANSGAIVVQVIERGKNVGLFERVIMLSGTPELSLSGPQNAVQDTEISQYIERRIKSDPDIWIIELDVPQGEQLAASVLCAG